jgi:hypothetical protein
MLDQTEAEAGVAAAMLDGKTYDLVVVGAGIAGLNALNSAAEYLPKGARVLLLDQKTKPGGMWTSAYDYVRLHQPHPMFTVGNQTWDWSRPRAYLAARDEVQAHLAGCLVRSAADLALTEGYGMTATACTEVMTPKGARGQVTFHPNGDAGSLATVTADQVIEAEGYNIPQPVAVSLSSSAVLSIVPDTLRETLAAHPDAPVFVVGGGKTGMDTAIEVIGQNPARPVSMLVGQGTKFFNRTRHLPTGAGRWTGGTLGSRLFRDVAMRFDGENEADVAAYFDATYATEPDAGHTGFAYGLLSEEELARIKDGTQWRKHDYLEDVTDTPDGPLMTLRSGEAFTVPEGSIIVACTGTIFRGLNGAVPKPCLSTHGKILTITTRDAMHFLTSVSGYFLPHLHYRGLLKDGGFYTIDLEALFQANRQAFVAATSAQAYLTQALAVKHLPLTVLDRCGLDLDRWFPFPRRMAALIRLKASMTPDVIHCRKVLDRVGARFGVQCGPLTPGDRSA